MLRLALATLLNARFGNFVVLIGLLCSSFVSINSGSHRRAPFDPLGDLERHHVVTGNQLCSRTLRFSFQRLSRGFRDTDSVK